MKEDAQVKILTAAKNFPFRFYLARWKYGGFEVKEVK
jgi:hypothetical protein